MSLRTAWLAAMCHSGPLAPYFLRQHLIPGMPQVPISLRLALHLYAKHLPPCLKQLTEFPAGIAKPKKAIEKANACQKSQLLCPGPLEQTPTAAVILSRQ